jgi:hypothetical protein
MAHGLTMNPLEGKTAIITEDFSALETNHCNNTQD